jgi:hypothetical protein
MLIASEDRQQSLDDLEIRIYATADGYTAEIRAPDGSAASCEMPPFPFESRDLSSLAPRSYGIELFRWLFQKDVLDLFRRSRWGAESYSRSAGPVGGLRLRLWLDREAGPVHGLRWEALYDPERDAPLAAETAFSRFVRSPAPYGWPVRERPLRVLLAAADPEGLAELEVRGIGSILDRLAGTGTVQQVRPVLEVDRLFDDPSLQDLQERLRRRYHILHLWARTTADGSLVIRSGGLPQQIPFRDVAKALLSPDAAPHLVFLVPGGLVEPTAEEKLADLATALLDAGAQAVVVLQGTIDEKELLIFTERFYDVLLRSGTIDVAVTEARTKLYNIDPESWGWTAPALHVRVAEGLLFQPLPEMVQSLVQSPVFQSFKENL